MQLLVNHKLLLRTSFKMKQIRVSNGQSEICRKQTLNSSTWFILRHRKFTHMN